MEKIIKLKKLFKKYNLDGYIIPKNDEFFGEYVAKEEDRLKFITNFSGSYGFALILKEANYLFVDGRYTLQAKKESGKNFNIITIPKSYPYNILKSNSITNINNIQDGFVLIGDNDILIQICTGIFLKVKNKGICMIGTNK